MELRDYLVALRRHWVAWAGATALGAVVGALVVVATPATYESSARVFVAVSPSIPNSANFVQQRVKSYPDVALSEAVLGPVREQLGLDESVRELRGRVSATNPADTTQLEVSVRGADPERAAEVANALAERLAVVVTELETPPSGERPVVLTVTDPAGVPTTAVAPVPSLVVGLGLLVGLFLGLAAAVTRSRLDPGLYTAEDVARAWGAGDVEVVVPLGGRAGRSPLAGRPAGVLARRLEAAAEDRPLRVHLLCPAPDGRPAALAFAEELAGELAARGLPASVAGAQAEGAVRLELADPLAPQRSWRPVAERSEPVVLVLPAGRVSAADLREVRGVLGGAGVTPLAVAVVPARPGPVALPAPATVDAVPPEPSLVGAAAGAGRTGRAPARTAPPGK